MTDVLPTPVPRPDSTHASVAKRLKERTNSGKGVDVSLLEPYEHERADEVFYVGPMMYEHHKAWHELRRFEEIKHEQAERGESDPMDRSMSDAYLMANSVYTADGVLLGEEISADLFKLPLSGPDNHNLLSIAEKHNPPREQLANEVAQMLNKNACDSVLWRLLIDGGLVRVLIDFMATTASEEEREWAARELVKAEEVVYAFYPLFGAKDAAKAMGVTFGKGMSLIAEYGTADAAVAGELAKIRVRESLATDEHPSQEGEHDFAPT